MREKSPYKKEALSLLVQEYLESNEEIFCLKGLHGLIVKEMEKPLIQLVLKKTRNNQSKAAAILGLNRNTLKKKMVDLNLVKVGKARD